MSPQSAHTPVISLGLTNEEEAVPAMSVVLVTPNRFQSLRKTIQHLQAQTVHDRLEIIIVAPSLKKLDLDPSELDGFFRYDVAEAEVSESIAAAKAVGIRKATAPVVVFGEDHNYPERSWAEALIDAHRQPWAGVGPGLWRNTRPGGKVVIHAPSALLWRNALNPADALRTYFARYDTNGPDRRIAAANPTGTLTLARGYGARGSHRISFWHWTYISEARCLRIFW